MAEAKNVSREEFDKLVAKLGYTMKPEDAEGYYKILCSMEDEVNLIEGLKPETDATILRTYHAPSKDKNPYNAWSHQFELKDNTVSGGILEGKTVVLKDNTSVAGVPMTIGTEPYNLSSDTPYPVPTRDSTIVRRVVAAGGTIIGTTTCENYCMSGLSFTSAIGPVDNPWQPGFSSGGSSSGCASLLALNQIRDYHKRNNLPPPELLSDDAVDLAIGCDQGGSIRLPAAYCGIYGLKATHGLVPYTGIGALHALVDHVGPMATSIGDLALLLSAIGGAEDGDELDPRQGPSTLSCAEASAMHKAFVDAVEAKKASGQWNAENAGKGLRVGVLQEALKRPELDPQVADVVLAAAEQFKTLGATVETVSIPLHSVAPDLWTAALRGCATDVFVANKTTDLSSYTMPFLNPPSVVGNQKWYETMTASSPAVVASVFAVAYLGDPTRFPTRYRNKAMAHVAELRRAYTKALQDYDVLLLPVTPSVAPPNKPDTEKDVLGKYQASLGVSGNTAPFNLTGHPALSMPGGWGLAKDGKTSLPVGIQLVGKHGDEIGVFMAGEIWELAGKGLDKKRQ